MAADYEYLPAARPQPAVEPCWMCGARLPVTQMVADGGSGCDSVRWYCADVRGCTERWTTRRPRLASGHGDRDAAAPARAAAGALSRPGARIARTSGPPPVAGTLGLAGTVGPAQ
jgi:hypothetical protein